MSKKEQKKNNKNKNKSKETVETEDIPNLSYKKEYVTFVIKPIHLDQVNRWAKWCQARGLSSKQDQAKAFALAMDILEGKTEDLISKDERIVSLQKQVHTHDLLLAELVNRYQELDDQPNEEELDANQKARLELERRKKARKRAEEKQKQNKKQKKVKKDE